MVLSSLIIAIGMVAAPATGAEPSVSGWRPSAPEARPLPVEPPKREAVEASIGRGVAFLLKAQNKNGSWGSARINRPGDIYAPVPGAHQAFRSATTALCVAALIDSATNTPETRAAIDRGEAWLLEHLPNLRRATADTIYNNWGHAYGVEGLARLYHYRAGDEPRRKAIAEQIREQIKLLKRYECVDGGWCYYDFDFGTQRPAGSTLSFVTATVLVALYDAKQIGIETPKRIIDRAVASIHRQQKPDFSYFYGEYLKWRPMRAINRPGGSLGRSQACNLALRLWDDKAVTDEVMADWLDRLFARNLWLDLGRKRPIPHESYFQVAGYFYYYGHYYAARVIDQLPASRRSSHQDHLAHILLERQQPDGSWWDFPMFDYHQQYGTAFAVMSLVRCRKDNSPKTSH